MKKPSQECYDLIKHFEGLSLKAYNDPGTGGKPYTIGYGTTLYPDGNAVELGDTCTEDEARAWLEHEVTEKANKVIVLIDSDTLKQCQFDALVSFAYNCGLGNLKSSTLLKKVKADPNDEGIRDEFMRWNRAAGKELKGLTIRRRAEVNLYFKI